MQRSAAAYNPGPNSHHANAAAAGHHHAAAAAVGVPAQTTSTPAPHHHHTHHHTHHHHHGLTPQQPTVFSRPEVVPTPGPSIIPTLVRNSS